MSVPVAIVPDIILACFGMYMFASFQLFTGQYLEYWCSHSSWEFLSSLWLERRLIARKLPFKWPLVRSFCICLWPLGWKTICLCRFRTCWQDTVLCYQSWRSRCYYLSYSIGSDLGSSLILLYTTPRNCVGNDHLFGYNAASDLFDSCNGIRSGD